MSLRTFVSSLIILPLSAACAVEGATDELPFEDGAAPDPGKADHLSLELTPLDAPVGDLRFEGGLHILTSADAFRTRLDAAPPAAIDFDREWVLFFGLGTRNTGGYAAAIDSLEYYPSAGALVADTREIQPGFDCIVTQALTSPYVMFRFEIPEGAAWYAQRHETETRRCGPTEDDLQQQLAESRADWDARVAANGPNYTYTREFFSFLGFSSQTTLVVRDGVVVERHYESQHGDAEGETWSELGEDVGSHAAGAPAVLVEDLYEQCAEDVLTKDPEENFINLSFADDGLLQVCHFTPRQCQDDCSRGPDIASLAFDVKK